MIHVFRKLFLIPAVAVMAFSASCSHKVESAFKTIPYVDAMMQDSLYVLSARASKSGGKNASIIVVGDPKSCANMTEAFLYGDEFDNIDGQLRPDGLPDFAGETITSIFDVANSPYEGVLAEEGGEEHLREIGVRNAILAIKDSLRCKVLVFCSPLSAEFGASDIEDFFSKIGCKVPVLYQSDSSSSLTRDCYRLLRERNAFTHIIAYPKGRAFMTFKSDSTSRDFKLVACPEVPVINPIPDSLFHVVTIDSTLIPNLSASVETLDFTSTQSVK